MTFCLDPVVGPCDRLAEVLAAGAGTELPGELDVRTLPGGSGARGQLIPLLRPGIIALPLG